MSGAPISVWDPYSGPGGEDGASRPPGIYVSPLLKRNRLTFVGRQADALAVDQWLKAPHTPHTLLLAGHHGVGLSTFLRGSSNYARTTLGMRSVFLHTGTVDHGATTWLAKLFDLLQEVDLLDRAASPPRSYEELSEDLVQQQGPALRPTLLVIDGGEVLHDPRRHPQQDSLLLTANALERARVLSGGRLPVHVLIGWTSRNVQTSVMASLAEDHDLIHALLKAAVVRTLKPLSFVEGAALVAQHCQRLGVVVDESVVRRTLNPQGIQSLTAESEVRELAATLPGPLGAMITSGGLLPLYAPFVAAELVRAAAGAGLRGEVTRLDAERVLAALAWGGSTRPQPPAPLGRISPPMAANLLSMVAARDYANELSRLEAWLDDVAAVASGDGVRVVVGSPGAADVVGIAGGRAESNGWKVVSHDVSPREDTGDALARAVSNALAAAGVIPAGVALTGLEDLVQTLAAPAAGPMARPLLLVLTAASRLAPLGRDGRMPPTSIDALIQAFETANVRGALLIATGAPPRSVQRTPRRVVRLPGAGICEAAAALVSRCAVLGVSMSEMVGQRLLLGGIPEQRPDALGDLRRRVPPALGRLVTDDGFERGRFWLTALLIAHEARNLGLRAITEAELPALWASLSLHSTAEFSAVQSVPDATRGYDGPCAVLAMPSAFDVVNYLLENPLRTRIEVEAGLTQWGRASIEEVLPALVHWNLVDVSPPDFRGARGGPAPRYSASLECTTLLDEAGPHRPRSVTERRAKATLYQLLDNAVRVELLLTLAENGEQSMAALLDLLAGTLDRSTLGKAATRLEEAGLIERRMVWRTASFQLRPVVVQDLRDARPLLSGSHWPEVAAALGSEVRLHIREILGTTPLMTDAEIGDVVGLSQSRVTRNRGILRAAGLDPGGDPTEDAWAVAARGALEGALLPVVARAFAREIHPRDIFVAYQDGTRRAIVNALLQDGMARADRVQSEIIVSVDALNLARTVHRSLMAVYEALSELERLGVLQVVGKPGARIASIGLRAARVLVAADEVFRGRTGRPYLPSRVQAAMVVDGRLGGSRWSGVV